MARRTGFRIRRHRLAGLLAAGLAVTMIAACGSSGSAGGGAGSAGTGGSAGTSAGSASAGSGQAGSGQAGSTTSGTSAASGASTAGQPKRGGTLTVGLVGGSSKDTLDAHRAVTHPDEARSIELYDPLLTRDHDYKFQPDLAVKVEPNDTGDVWTVTLRDGIKFSDGRPITVDDVISTFQRITDPDNPTNGTAGLKALDRDGFVKVDDRTLEFHFTRPVVNFKEKISGYASGIVPTDYDPKHPVSSGPFMLKSFTPGKQSVMVPNPYYWRKGQPYVDKLVLIDFPDDTARVNALLSGQVDAIDALPLSQVQVVKANPNLKVLESKSGGFIPFTMRVDKAPFNDPKVRQAFRLIVNRKQMVNQVLSGHGSIGNDMYARLGQCYPTDIPQRTQNIAKAKKLLQEAGKSNLTVTLVTASVAAGVVEAAQVFAQQAKAAGVTVKVKKVDPGVFFGDKYLKWTFSQDFYFTHSYLGQISASTGADAPYNETHWADPQWQALAKKIKSTVDTDKRCDLIHQAQKIEYDRGGYIIWGFPNVLDAYRSDVHGFVPDPSGIPLSRYDFRSVWLGN